MPPASCPSVSSCLLPTSLLHLLFLCPSFSSFSSFFLFFLLFFLLFSFVLLCHFSFSYFLNFPIFLLFLLSSFPFFLTLFLIPSIILLFSISFFTFSPSFFFSYSPLAFPLLSVLFPRAQAGGPSRSRRGWCQQGCGSRGAPGAAGVGSPGPIAPSCLLGASTAQPHSRGQKQWAGGAGGKEERGDMRGWQSWG